MQSGPLFFLRDELAQQKWAAWRKKTDVENITLAILSDQLTEVCQFLDPTFVGDVGSAAQLMPPERVWL